jgi:hypothetical protein
LGGGFRMAEQPANACFGNSVVPMSKAGTVSSPRPILKWTSPFRQPDSSKASESVTRWGDPRQVTNALAGSVICECSGYSQEQSPISRAQLVEHLGVLLLLGLWKIET